MKNFLKNHKLLILLSLIIIFGAFLRLYNFNDLARFNTDQVRDAKMAEKILEGKEFPLLGPKAGGTYFKLGPAFYYLQAISGFIFGNNPSGMVLFVGILSVLSIPLLFLFLRYYFSVNISLLLVLAYSFSFYVIKYSRFGWNPNIIPFFFILFLLSLLKIIGFKDKKFGKWHVFLIISSGIGVQLHTLLLVLMPVLILLTYAYIFFKEKKINFLNLIIVISGILLLNLPFFVYDFQNEGKNIKNFLSGTEKKTAKNSSMIENILKDGQFFIQGNTYAISSFEPQKNWIKTKKLLKSNNVFEITAAIFGTAFSLFGLFYLIKKFISEKEEEKKIFLGLTTVSIIFSFLILLPIANELNIRYLIILIFLPYVFLGFLIEFLLKNTKKYPAFFVIFIFLALLAFLNLRTYIKTYNLENYTARTSSYGGISVKESRDISNFMFDLSKEYDPSEINFSVPSFKFSPSIDYFNEKRNIPTKSKDNSSRIKFIISDYKDVEKTMLKIKNNNNLINSFKTGRFTVFAFESKK
jgi:4-amino-4-deoxy-L-arabinose transferase-like glycosyltransferase